MVRLWPGSAAVLMGAAVAAAVVLAAGAAPRDTVLVSRASGAQGAKARGGFYNGPGVSQLSLDGRYATFASDATNLDPADQDTILDVFLRDLRATASPWSAMPRLVAGTWSSTRSLPTSTSPTPTRPRDMYVRALLTAETTLVGRADGPGGAKANGETLRGRLSADGRFVAFESSATNLDAADPEPDADVFVRDLLSHQTALVTEELKHAELAAFSDDGSHIAYLLTGGGDHGDLYVQDLRSGLRTFVSASAATSTSATSRPAG